MGAEGLNGKEDDQKRLETASAFKTRRGPPVQTYYNNRRDVIDHAGLRNRNAPYSTGNRDGRREASVDDSRARSEESLEGRFHG